MRRHPKLLHLCEITKWTINEAIGTLHSFWWWALDYAEDGDISKYSPYQVALAIDANLPEPEKLFSFLIESKFLDKNLKIHDWWDYAGLYLTKKYHNNNPAYLSKIKGKYFTPKGAPKGVQKRKVATPISSLPTNLYLPNQHNTKTYVTLRETQFEEFWGQYPSRNGKKLLKTQAGKFFLSKIKDEEVEPIMQAVRNYANSTGCRNGYVRDAIRFLQNDYWRDWIEPETRASPDIDKRIIRQECNDCKKASCKGCEYDRRWYESS